MRLLLHRSATVHNNEEASVAPCSGLGTASTIVESPKPPSRAGDEKSAQRPRILGRRGLNFAH